MRKCEALAFAIKHEFAVVNESHPVGGGKFFSAGADEIDVGALFQHQAGSQNGIANALDTRHAASFHSSAVHQESVELYTAVGGEEASAAGIEGRVIFENDDGCFDSVEGGTSAREDMEACFERGANSDLVGGRIGGRYGPGSAVNQENGHVG